MSSQINPHFFQDLPKTDLHCHLDGSLRLSTLIELAHEQGIALPSVDPVALAKVMGLGQIHKDLVGYLKAFDITCSVMQVESAIYRVAYELVEDAASENVWHIEIRFAPHFLMQKGLTMERVALAAATGARDAGEKYGVSTGIILCAMRMFSPEQSVEVAKTAVKLFNHGVIALDLAGPEDGYPPNKHVTGFFHVLEHFMNTTIHAGEAFGPQSIRQAIEECGAHRIGHGTRLYQDPELLAQVAQKRTPIEACLTSNLQTNAIDDLRKHPAGDYLHAGVCVTLNTDNRLMSATNMVKEFEVAHQMLGLGVDALKLLSLNGFEAAFLPATQKEALLERVAKRIKQL